MNPNTEEVLAFIANTASKYKGFRPWYDRTLKGGIFTKCPLKNNKLHGTCKIYFKVKTNNNLCVTTCEYIDGVRNGRYMETCGEKRIICYYVDDLLHGIYEEYNNDILIISNYYDHGKLIQ